MSKRLSIVRADDRDDSVRTISFRTPSEIPALFWLEKAEGLFPFAIDGNSILTSAQAIVPENRVDESYTLSEALAEQEKYVLETLRKHGYEVEFV